MKKVLLLAADDQSSDWIMSLLRNKGFCLKRTRDEVSAGAAILSGMHYDLMLACDAGNDRSSFLSRIREKRPRLPVIFFRHADSSSDALTNSDGRSQGPLLHSSNISLPSSQVNELYRLVRIALNANAGTPNPSFGVA